MLVKGKIKYLPAVVIQEIEDLKMEKGFKKDGVVLHEIVKYARVGRELERMMTFNFKNLPTRDIPMRRGRR